MYWRRKWQPTPVFLPGKSHGWRSLVGYGPRGRKDLDMIERFHSVHIMEENVKKGIYIYIYTCITESSCTPETNTML